MRSMCTVICAGLLAACAPGGSADHPAKSIAASNWQPAWAAPDAALLRPGSRIEQAFSVPNQIVPDLIPCTVSFLLVDPLTQSYYAGTAGHCTVNGETAADGIGTRVVLSGVGEIGTVVFDSDSPALQSQFNVEPRVDFSLILLDAGINQIAHPQVYGLEAPRGFIDCAQTAPGDRFAIYGNGVPFGAVEPLKAREGVLISCDGRDYAGYAAVSQGDSGSPVVHLAAGMALGIVSRLATASGTPATLTGATLPYIHSELAKTGLGDVALATADGGYATFAP